MAIRVQSATQDGHWITIVVERADENKTVVSVNREALESIIQSDPRPPEILLDILCERAIKRMPVPNSDDGIRLITAYNLSLVWPT